MNYEEHILAKHQFEDAFKEIVQILSIMDRRELELAAARIGDGVRQDECLDDNSALLTARIIQMMLALRARNELSQSKLLRVWMRRKKKQYTHAITSSLLAPEIERHEKEEARIKHIRDLERRDHVNKVWQWSRHVDTLPLWKRLFNKPPYPGLERLTPLPERPMHSGDLASQIAKTKTFYKILIDMVYHYKYPNIEYSEEYVKEDHVRTTTIQLLEDKR